MSRFLFKNIIIRTLGIVSISLLATVIHAQQNSNAGPMIQKNTAVKISAHVYVIPDNSVPGVPNIGIIVGDKATLIIDTGLGYKNGLIVAEEAKKIARDNQIFLVTTHVHPEHDLGAHAFPENIKMIRSTDQLGEIAEFGMRTANVFRNRSSIMKNLLEGAEFRDADIEFENEYKLELGGVQVRIIALGPNHTPGDTASFVESDKVLFSGDVVMKGLPAFASPKSSLAHWLNSLDLLAELKAETIVPSHGPMGGLELIADYQRYLTTIKDKTHEMKIAGLTSEQVIAKLSPQLEEQFSKSRRISGAIKKAYAEAE